MQNLQTFLDNKTLKEVEAYLEFTEVFYMNTLIEASKEMPTTDRFQILFNYLYGLKQQQDTLFLSIQKKKGA